MRNDDGRLAFFEAGSREFRDDRERSIGVRVYFYIRGTDRGVFSPRTREARLSAFNAILSLPRDIFIEEITSERRRSRSRIPRGRSRDRSVPPQRKRKRRKNKFRRCPPLRRNFGEIYEAVRAGRLSPVADNFILSAADFPDPAV